MIPQIKKNEKYEDDGLFMDDVREHNLISSLLLTLGDDVEVSQQFIDAFNEGNIELLSKAWNDLIGKDNLKK